MLIHVSVQGVITSARLLDRMCLRPQADLGSLAGPFSPRVLRRVAIKSSITRAGPESQSFHFTASLGLPSGRVGSSWRRRRLLPHLMTRRSCGEFDCEAGSCAVWLAVVARRVGKDSGASFWHFLLSFTTSLLPPTLFLSSYFPSFLPSFPPSFSLHHNFSFSFSVIHST